MAKKKVSKASRAASAKLKGEQVAIGKELNEDSLSTFSGKESGGSFLNRPLAPGMKLTWKAVLLFLLACFMLDLVLYLLFHLGFDSCYAVLCAF